MPLFILFVIALVSAPSLASAASCASKLTGRDSISIIDSDTGRLIVLPAVSKGRLTERLRQIRNVKYKYEGNLYQVPWAYIEGNHCQERATLTALALATGRSVFNGLISRAMENQFVNRPQIASAFIRIFDNIELERTLIAPDNLQSVEKEIIWYTHIGVVVNVEGTPQVIDLSVSDEPMPLKSWIKRYSKKSMPLLSGEEANDLSLYLQKVGVNIPKKKAGYAFASRVPEEGSFPPPGGWLRYNLDVKSQLEGDRESLSRIFPNLPSNQIQNVRVRLETKN